MNGVERLMEEILKEYEGPGKIRPGRYDKSKRYTRNPEKIRLNYHGLKKPWISRIFWKSTILID